MFHVLAQRAAAAHALLDIFWVRATGAGVWRAYLRRVVPVLLAALPLMLLAAGGALAQADPFAAGTQRGQSLLGFTLSPVKLIGLGGIVCCVVVGVVTRGKFPWPWLLCIAGGFLLLLIGPGLLNFLSQGINLTVT